MCIPCDTDCLIETDFGQFWAGLDRIGDVNKPAFHVEFLT